MAVVHAATCSRAACIIAVTGTGKSARAIAKYRPSCPIISITRSPQAARQMRLIRGLMPTLFDQEKISPWNADIDAR